MIFNIEIAPICISNTTPYFNYNYTNNFILREEKSIIESINQNYLLFLKQRFSKRLSLCLGKLTFYMVFGLLLIYIVVKLIDYEVIQICSLFLASLGILFIEIQVIFFCFQCIINYEDSMFERFIKEFNRELIKNQGYFLAYINTQFYLLKFVNKKTECNNEDKDSIDKYNDRDSVIDKEIGDN